MLLCCCLHTSLGECSPARSSLQRPTVQPRGVERGNMASFQEAVADVTPSRWVVHKFGGTSVGSADCMRKCVDIIRPLTSIQRVAVVVSAMGGKPKVTDLLLDLVHSAVVGRKEEIALKMDLIRTKHRECIADILGKTPEIHQQIMGMIDSDLRDITDLLKAVALMKMAHEQILELVSGYGELWSATILAAVMRQEGMPFKFLNARDVLFVNELNKVCWEESGQKLAAFLEAAEAEFTDAFPTAPSTVPKPHLLITGYVATTLEGVATTLKRDGSDYSASIFGKMLRATTITIWTDVSGVFSADPRRVPEAQILPEVSYTEAIELAYFGAKVIHPKTMEPAIESNIPIFIRNTFAPEHAGTRIYLPSKEQKVRERSVCGFTTVDGISLLNIEGTGVLGVPGMAHRLFGALHNDNIAVMFIAQASSEHSICFATHTVNADRAKEAIKNTFFYELKHSQIVNIRIIKECSIIAAVGESMHALPGVAGLFFGALGDASINVLSIAQGCDERNISAVVYTADSTRALRAVHSSFWLSSLELSIGIVGTGRVGSALLQGLLENLELLENRLGVKIKIRGVTNSRKMLLGEDLSSSLMDILSFFNPESVPLSDAPRKSDSHRSMENLQIAMSDCGEDKLDTNLEVFLAHVKAGPTPHTIMVDVTTSQGVAELHPSWLSARAHVVTANKRALSSGLDLYNAVFSQVRATHHMYMSEVTIGASLPIRTTLNDILCSGDSVSAIVGLMSVSVNMVISGICEDGLTFTESLLRTYRDGLFEDDTFSDLEGMDAAEKILLLARELGFSMEMQDLDIEPLAVRRPIVNWDYITDEFRAEDESMGARARAAAARGCTLRYVQRIECDPATELGGPHDFSNVSVSSKLEEVPVGSAHAMVKGALYHFSFHTGRYSQAPLIVQGPLSDPAITASGIIGDILRVARSVGAKDRGPVALAASPLKNTGSRKNKSS